MPLNGSPVTIYVRRAVALLDLWASTLIGDGMCEKATFSHLNIFLKVTKNKFSIYILFKIF